MPIALTRPTGPELAQCELTHIDRVPIDIGRAHAEHAAYFEALRSLGVTVIELPRMPDHPDAVFVEDVACVLPEVAVVLRPGVPSRLGEMASMAAALEPFRPCVTMAQPATLDGGDVIVLGRRVVIGRTSRSNEAGVEWLRATVEPLGYRVDVVPVEGVLHLKSAATVVDPDTVLVNPASVELGFLDVRLLPVPEGEPHGANVVAVGGKVLADAGAPRTLELLGRHGATVVPLEVAEFAKAEGALSCKGVIFEG